MGSVNFFLKGGLERARLSKKKTLIYLQYKYNGNKLTYSTKQFVEFKNWDGDKQRVKSNNQTTSDGKYKVNDLLKNMEQVVEHAYNTEIKAGIPEKKTLKSYLDNFMNQNEKDENRPTLLKLIDRFINNEIKHKGRDRSENTIKTYQTFRGHLSAYNETLKQDVDFEAINLDFYYKYVSFLQSHRFETVKDKSSKNGKAFRAVPVPNNEGLIQNTISKDIQILKVIMGEAVDLGYTKNMAFTHKKFAVHREETHAVYLTKEELNRLYNCDLSHNKELEEARDLFVFGSLVGLRFSDYASIKPEYIVNMDGELFIKMITKKTKELVIIPCDPIVLEIFEKYSHAENRLPSIPGNTTDSQNAMFNRNIKEACKAAGLTEKGRLASNPEVELWKCIVSHTPRRTFATNHYLDGFPTIDLMKIIGHKTEKAFMNYIKLSKLDAAKRLNEHSKNMRLKWAKKLLMVETMN
jgi:hypothetical protein